ncbi:MAG: S4 domain-containing protein [Chitinophagaceae bacterium]
MDKVRLDKYLWSIRIFKTREQASLACSAGKVKLLGKSVKPAKAVQLDDIYEIKKEDHKIIIKVLGIIQKRVAYAEAIKNYLDMTPEEEKIHEKPMASSFYTGKRLSKVGRPTKQQRRDLDDFMEQ